MQLSARLSQGESLGDRIVKVNHAGEHGAVNIYRGQILISRLLWPRIVFELGEFKGHEERHRALFAAELARRGRPRCRSYRLCGLGSFVLGLITALMGPAAVAATTVAVERVVLRHLEVQLSTLRGGDPEACAAVSAIMEDEKSHYDRAFLQERQGVIWPRIISPVVAASTEGVIWLGMHL